MGFEACGRVFIGFLTVVIPIMQALQRNFLARNRADDKGPRLHNREIRRAVMELRFALVLEKTIHESAITGRTAKAKRQWRLKEVALRGFGFRRGESASGFF